MSSDTTIEAHLNNLRVDFDDMRSDIKALTAAVTRLAVVEERQAQGADALERAFKMIDALTADVQALKMEGQISKQSNIWVDRSVTAIVTGAAVFAAKKLGWM